MDMEITADTVSRLILGHLYSEKNKSTYNEYLTSCQYFRKYAASSSKRRPHIITRFRGLSLLQVLQEYAAVYNLVQEYLESGDYFRNHKSTCLLDELEYLLNLTGCRFEGNRSRSSTPFRVRSTSPLLQPNTNLSPIIESCNAESDVNTTALQDLPGNSRDTSRTKDNTLSKDLSKSCSKDSSSRINISANNDEGKDALDNEESPVKSTNSTTKDCSLERIQQTILDHPEFQAKIAENINSIINTSVHKASKETKAVTELDSTIKMILQKTEEDPLFERLLEDLIGDATSVSSQHNQHSETTELHTPKKCPSSVNAVSIKQRLRSSRKSVAGNDTLGIEVSNNDVIDKIVSVSAGTSTLTSVNNMPNVNVSTEANGLAVPIRATNYQNQNLVTTKNSLSNAEIILYDGPIDTLFQQNPPTNIQSHNESGLLMLQPQSHQTQTIVNVDTASCNSSFATTVSNVSSSDVARSQQIQQPFYMISDTGDVISVPTQMIVCTSDAATMAPQQQYIVAQPQQTFVLPSSGSKYTTQPSNQPSGSTLVDLFSTYKPTEPVATNIPRRKSTNRSKRIKTILPMPTYKIDILPMPEEDTAANTKVQPAPEAAPDNASDDNSATSCVKENVSSNLNVSNASTNYQVTPMVVTPEVPIKKSVTPKSGSHVRVLDFNFVTPAKEVVDTSTRQHKKESKNGGKSVKSLFTTPSTVVTKKFTEVKSWDANLRQLAIPSAVLEVSKQSEEVKMKCLEDCEQQPAEVPQVEDVQQKATEDRPVKLNDTVQDADAIEKALLQETPAKIELQKKTPKKLQKHSSQIVKKSLRIRKKSEPVQRVVEKSDNSPNTVEAADTLLTLSKPPLKEDTQVTPIVLQTASATKSRIKRKCNIDSSIKQEVTVTRVREIKSLDILTESGAKLILSPSKLANKRSLVAEPSTSAVMDLTKAIMSMPTLETPIKLNPCNNPETPNVFPSQTLASETPFTKMFNEQMEGVDISAIPTPKLPITPNLHLISPFNINQSGCFNRPTDYSTSSSYYQPSDSEQNKSLEKQIIEECKRLENGNGKKMPTNSQVETQSDVLERLEDEDKQKEVKNLEAIAAVMKSIKTNIGIGRKNLNLIPKVRNNSETSSEANSTSSSSSSSTSSSDTDSDDSICQKTIIDKHKSVEEVVTSKAAQDINSILSSTNFKAELKVVLPEITLTQQEKVLKDLEAKRKRTIAKFKGKEIKKEIAPPSKGVVTRSSRGRLIKTVTKPPLEVIDQTKTKLTKPKTKTPPTKRTKRRSPLKPLSKHPRTKPAMADKQLTHQLDPLDIVETQLSEQSAASTPVAIPEEPVVKKQTQEESRNILNMILSSAKENDRELCYKAVKCDKSSKGGENTSKGKDKDGHSKEKKVGGGGIVSVPESKVNPDLEAEKLVKGLKQWGIHLIPKSKSTTENIPDTESVQNTSLNTSDNIEVTTFDDKLYTENDSIHVTFDYNSTAIKSVTSYNLEVLNRKFTSRIFIEELDEDVDIPLSVSPFETVLDLPAVETNKVQILEDVIVAPKIESKVQDDLGKRSTEVPLKTRFSLGYLSPNDDEMPKSITEFQMIRDNQAKLDNSIDATTPRKSEDDSLYDFALTTDSGKVAESPGKSSKKRPLNESIDEQSPKRPKIDHEQLLQELSTSDKKKSSKSTTSLSNTHVKSKSDRQLLERIDVEHFLSVLHP